MSLCVQNKWWWYIGEATFMHSDFFSFKPPFQDSGVISLG